jgi:cell division transport system permease protein
VRALGFFFGEATRSLWRRRGGSLLAVAASTISLFVLGLFLLAGSNASRILERWSAAAEFSVYVSDAISADERAAIDRTLATSGVVIEQSFITSDQALERFSREFPDLAGAARAMPSNPLPASYEVRLRPALAGDAAVDQLATRLRTLPGVTDVRYDRRWIDRLLAIVRMVRGVGFALAGLFIAAAAITIMSVVRLALLARRQEIEIMQLVGAPLAYIRGPFVVEGTLLGLVGAVFASAALWGLYLSGRGPLIAWASGIMDTGDLTFLPVTSLLGLLAGGTLIGAVGGGLAARTAR